MKLRVYHGIEYLIFIEKHFLKYFLKIVIIYKHIVMIELILLTFHVRHGLKIVSNFII